MQTALTLLQSNYYIFTFVGCMTIENKMLKIKSVIPSAVTCNTLNLFFEIITISAAKDCCYSFNISLSTPAIEQNALPKKTEPKSFSYIPDLNFLLYSLAVKKQIIPKHTDSD